MRPKGKLFALFAVFAAIGLVTASGAFTTVQADRTATVNVEGDGSALLQLTSTSGPNGAFADTSGDAITIDLGTATSAGGSGVNDQAVTKIDNIINVTNQGTQEVTLTVTSYSTPGGSSLDTGDDASAPNFYVYDDSASSTDLQDTTITLGPGEGTNVSVFVDTTGNSLSSSESIDVTVALEASAT